MTTIDANNWILRMAISVIIVFHSCGPHGNSKKIESVIKTESKSNFESCDDLIEKPKVFTDTIFAESGKEISSQIQNNRVIILRNKNYKLDSTLLIDNIENLKIVGTGTTELITQQNSTVLNLQNSRKVSLENLIFKHSKEQQHIGKQGILRIEHSSNITVLKCRILGDDTFGLSTNDVCTMKFENSEIRKCKAVIFELSNSRKIDFKNSKFRDSELAISVLGGFTNSTKEVKFTNCKFINNQPKIRGNPVFNFDNNYERFEEKIIFQNCTFKNNQGYKWYGKKIKLKNCNIDSSDFIGLQG